MRRLIGVFCAVALLMSPVANANQQVGAKDRYAGTKWIKLWEKRDHNLMEATRVASATYGVSLGWLLDCNGSEGGSTARWKLRQTIVDPYALGPGPGGKGYGWNNQGSYAFGPWQFMMDSKPAPYPHQWGTFGAYDDAAFRAARQAGTNIPYRYKRPDSYVGQAFVASYMFDTGRSSHWQGDGC